MLYDWEGGIYFADGFGQNNPNGKTYSSQITPAVDTVIDF
jgi:hypothetical protein